MIDHLHPQKLSYNTVNWVTTKLRLVFKKICKNSIFDLSSGPVSYDIEYYKSLIDGGYVKHNDLWIFWMKHEAPCFFTFKDIKNLHNVCKELKLDESRVVFINGDMDLDKNYDEWFKSSDFDKPINCFGFPWLFLHDREDLLKSIGYNPYKFIKYKDRDKLPTKKFICLNGTYNKSRQYIIDKLENFKEYGYLSDLNRGIKLDNISIDKLVGEQRNDEPSVFLLDDFHKDSYFSIVNEAAGGWAAFNQDKIYAYFTEKITKPLYYGQPFILIGWKNSLKFLKEMGFKTYDDVFDESHDELETWEERTKFAWNEIEKILNLPDNKFNILFEKVQDNVIYNQNRFFTYDGYVDDFITKLSNIYEKTSISV